jgi:hypothetical protein
VEDAVGGCEDVEMADGNMPRHVVGMDEEYGGEDEGGGSFGGLGVHSHRGGYGYGAGAGEQVGLAGWGGNGINDFSGTREPGDGRGRWGEQGEGHGDTQTHGERGGEGDDEYGCVPSLKERRLLLSGALDIVNKEAMKIRLLA